MISAKITQFTSTCRLPDLSLISEKIARILVEFDKNLPHFLDSNVSGGQLPPRPPASYAFDLRDYADFLRSSKHPPTFNVSDIPRRPGHLIEPGFFRPNNKEAFFSSEKSLLYETTALIQ